MIKRPSGYFVSAEWTFFLLKKPFEKAGAMVDMAAKLDSICLLTQLKIVMAD